MKIILKLTENYLSDINKLYCLMTYDMAEEADGGGGEDVSDADKGEVGVEFSGGAAVVAEAESGSPGGEGGAGVNEVIVGVPRAEVTAAGRPGGSGDGHGDSPPPRVQHHSPYLLRRKSPTHDGASPTRQQVPPGPAHSVGGSPEAAAAGSSSSSPALATAATSAASLAVSGGGGLPCVSGGHNAGATPPSPTMAYCPSMLPARKRPRRSYSNGESSSSEFFVLHFD